jgi:hypothetical protein
VTLWEVIRCLLGGVCVTTGLSNKKFTPLGWPTSMIWGSGENARIPRWVAGPFYVLLGSFLIYWAIKEK